MTPFVVIDASVAIKWVVQEPGAEAALALRQCRLLAPELLVSECANVLWKKVHRREHSVEEAALAAQLLEHADIELVSLRPMLERATRLSVALVHPAYDCFYLALAETRGCPFVTADERLGRKAQAYRGPVRVLTLATVVADLGLAGNA